MKRRTLSTLIGSLVAANTVAAQTVNPWLSAMVNGAHGRTR